MSKSNVLVALHKPKVSAGESSPLEEGETTDRNYCKDWAPCTVDAFCTACCCCSVSGVGLDVLVVGVVVDAAVGRELKSIWNCAGSAASRG